MNRLRLLAVGMVLAFAVPAIAQQPATATAQQLPSVEHHLDVLSQKLSLTPDQKEKARPILQRMQDALQPVVNDTSLTVDQQHEKIHGIRIHADRELRSILTEEQKKTLDELESEMHHNP